jgi:hypothetical protein
MEPTAVTDTPRPRHRARSTFSLIFGVLGVVGVLVSVIAVWAHQVLFDPKTVSAAVEQTLLEPEVTDALAAFLTDQIIDAVDVEKLVEEKVPDSLASLSPVLVGGVRTIVDDALSRVLADDTTREVIVQATERAHEAVMRVLEGGRLSDGLTVEEDQVSINLLPIVSRGLEALQDAGLLTRVDLPTFSPGGDPADQIAQLEDAIGRDLPDEFGQMVVYESEKIAEAQAAISRAQQALVLFRRSLIVIIALTVGCLIASVALAVRRRRALVAVALGVVAAMGIGRAIVRTVVEKAPELALKPGSRAAIRSMVDSLASGLQSLVTAALIAGLIVALITYLTGSSRSAVALRSRASSTGASVSSVVGDHRDGVAIGAFALAVLVIAFYGFSAIPLLVASLLVVGGAAALWLIPSGPAATAPPDLT